MGVAAALRATSWWARALVLLMGCVAVAACFYFDVDADTSCYSHLVSSRDVEVPCPEARPAPAAVLLSAADGLLFGALVAAGLSRSWRITVGLLLLLTAGAFAFHRFVLGGDACTQVGAESAVGIDLHEYQPAHPAFDQAEICFQDGCALSGSGGGPFPRVRKDDLRAGTTYPVTLRLLGRGGDVLLERRVEITPKRYQPNGPGCGPVVAQARIAVDARGVVRVS